ncbi:MAG: hypothetical protein K9L59_11800 [Desulfobacterales bacterium]|nr:hypothetical protein [Desulfobacterales bacterium]
MFLFRYGSVKIHVDSCRFGSAGRQFFENPVKQRGLAVSVVRVKQDILSGV